MPTPGLTGWVARYHEPYTYGPALTVGGGMDYALPFLGGQLGLRLFQADYRILPYQLRSPTAIPNRRPGQPEDCAPEHRLDLSHGQHSSSASCDLQLHRVPVAGISWRPDHGHRHGDESEPEKDSNL